MSLMTAVVSHLLSDAALTALIGARLYPERLPESTSENPNTMPLVTYQLIDDPIVTTYDNKSIYRTRVQVDAWGGSYKSAQAVADALFAALHGRRGVMGDQSVFIGNVFRISRKDASDPNVKLFRVSQDFLFAHRENS